jgi:hypothetical protein
MCWQLRKLKLGNLQPTRRDDPLVDGGDVLGGSTIGGGIIKGDLAGNALGKDGLTGKASGTIALAGSTVGEALAGDNGSDRGLLRVAEPVSASTLAWNFL